MSTRSVAVNGKSGPMGMPETKQAGRSLAKKRQDRCADWQTLRSVTRVLAAGLLALGIASGARAANFAVPPAAPSGLTVTMATTGELDLSWTANSNNEQAFQVQVLDPHVSGVSWLDIGTVPAHATTFPWTHPWSL